ncbi:hypothetical protein E2R51_02410 [Jeotgalibacillus sp. S-D1]|uniref:hypothetical protein n=1 Tax=Jeotgalibacillus sp. S-D1 TaxID=2552189 RepID=UPI001059FC41|nr:hypothetical protein [Jeotgalibacillus sp. S-D1]TDL34590.1 hypothetical protein E2R51_02410 [Jeotgalibacillus sp. S-D1]
MNTLSFDQIKKRLDFLVYLDSIFTDKKFKLEYHDDSFHSEKPQVILTPKVTTFQHYRFIINAVDPSDCLHMHLLELKEFILSEDNEIKKPIFYINEKLINSGIQCIISPYTT